jgi:DinB family protein/mycothiol maleylpyruvate isomerase-like protein
VTDRSEHERLSAQEATGWDGVIEQIDRISPAATETPGAGPPGWSVKDVLFHLAAWADESAAQLAAIREGRYEAGSIDTDARNEEYLRAGRSIDTATARVRLERARARALAEWSAVEDLTAPAVEWFFESGAEHYAEHVPALRAFADRVGSAGRPGAADRRGALAAAEGEGWSEIDALIASMPPGAVERAGVTPDGWTVKDTMWHVARWWDDFVDAAPRFADPAFDPDGEDANEIDALNRTWFKESRMLPLVTVRERWNAARAEGLAAFRGMQDPSRTAERWFEECGLIHYEKHLIDLRRWAANAGNLPGPAPGPH